MNNLQIVCISVCIFIKLYILTILYISVMCIRRVYRVNEKVENKHLEKLAHYICKSTHRHNLLSGSYWKETWNWFLSIQTDIFQSLKQGTEFLKKKFIITLPFWGTTEVLKCVSLEKNRNFFKLTFIILSKKLDPKQFF